MVDRTEGDCDGESEDLRSEACGSLGEATECGPIAIEVADWKPGNFVNL